MKYIAGIFILGNVIYIISFAKYNFKKKNKMAAVGAIILALLIVILPVMVMFME